MIQENKRSWILEGISVPLLARSIILFLLLIRARPIENLCQFEGQTPEDGTFEPDCYKNVDESDYACKEKYRIMVSIVSRILDCIKMLPMGLNPSAPTHGFKSTKKTKKNENWVKTFRS